MDRRSQRLPDILFKLQGHSVYPHNKNSSKNYIRENVRRLREQQAAATKQKVASEKPVPLKATVRYANVESKVAKLIKDSRPSKKTQTVSEENIAKNVNSEEEEDRRVSSSTSDYSSLNLSRNSSPTHLPSEKEYERKEKLNDERGERRDAKLSGDSTYRRNISTLIHTESGIMPREEEEGRASRSRTSRSQAARRSASASRISSRNSDKLYSIYGSNKSSRSQSLDRRKSNQDKIPSRPLSKQSSVDFKKMNVAAVKEGTKNDKLSVTGCGLLPPNYKKGVVPKYLRKRQEQRKQEEEQKSYMKKMAVPVGHTLLPEQERLHTLQILNQRNEELLNEISLLPIRNDTLRLQNKRKDIEAELRQIEEGIKIFSRPKVFIKN